MTFDEFWPTLPPGMRRCGRKKGERAYTSAMTRTSPEAFETGLRAYIAGKEEWRPWMHFTTFCNGDMWEVEAEDYAEEVEKPYEQRRDEATLLTYVKTGDWRGAQNRQPTIEQARAKLHEAGWANMEPKLRVVE